jgi:RNA polymerase sigma-70 factor (ECF subfamily)
MLASQSVDDLEFAAQLRVARASWPELVPPVVFEAHLRARLDRGDVVTHLADLYLACACAHGVPRAIASFEREYLSHVPRYVARVTTSPHLLDEIMQQLRAKLLAGAPQAPPKIVDYRGVGALGGWLRVVALRSAIDVVRLRPEAVFASRDLAAKSLPGEGDLELEALRARHRQPFQEALEAALSAQPARARTLLRLHYLDGQGIDAIGVLYHVHRATAARWIESARAALLHDIRVRLALPDNDFESLAGLLVSGLHLSASRLR